MPSSRGAAHSFAGMEIAGVATATSGTTTSIRAPYRGTVVAEVPVSSDEDVATAFRSAQAARRDPLSIPDRVRILQRTARFVEEHADAFARAVASEAAKPISQAQVEVERCVSTLQFSAVAAETVTGEIVPVGASPAGIGKRAWTERIPVGVVGAITPFNFPLNLVAHKIGPAVAAGCPFVLKPASQTPVSALLLVAALRAAGLPEGHGQVVLGPGGRIGAALVADPHLAYLSFTGSPEVGWRLREAAPRIGVGLELGNNSPLIVHRDADVADVVRRVRLAGFAHAGQSCISTQRILVHTHLADEFEEALIAAVSSLRLGDPLDPETEVSALISPTERDRVLGWIDEAVVGGARLLVGGEVTDDGVLRPTVLADADPAAKVCAREVFGPVVVLRRFTDLGEAIAEANDTAYGLQAAIFTDHLPSAARAIDELDFGTVLVNEVPTWRADPMPYGGIRDSGNTKEGPAWAVRSMTREKLVVIG